MKHPIQLVKQALSQLSSLEKEGFDLTLSLADTTVTHSKIGGFPYIPKSQTPLAFPTDKSDRPLRMICQINLEKLQDVAPIFPLKEGILQFWISDQEESYGKNSDDPFSQENWRILYHKTVEEGYSEEEILTQYPDFVDITREKEVDFFFPVNCPEGFLLDAQPSPCPITLCDASFDPHFSKAFNALCPEHPIDSYADLDLPNKEMSVFLPFCSMEHRLLGYPEFSQEDPRTAFDASDTVLLLQLASELVEEDTGKELNWQDFGTANWFISPEDLENGDFSHVFFTWDAD